MNKKGKLPLLFLSIAVSLVLTGCGSKQGELIYEDETEKTEEVEQVKEETKKEEKSKEVEKEVEKEITVEDQIKNAIHKNLEYMNDENVEGYMNSLVLSEENANITRQATTFLFENGDFKSEILSLDILEHTETTAKVKVVQKTTGTNVSKEMQFNDNITTAIHILRVVDGEWKIASTELSDFVLLDSNGNPMSKTSEVEGNAETETESNISMEIETK